MTLLHFTFGALPYARDAKRGTNIIHMYVSQGEPTRTDDPGAERRAAKDAAKIIRDIVADNRSDDEEKLLNDGEMPPEAIPVFTFALGVAWDREHMMPSYRQMDYASLCAERKYAPVSGLGRELYDYTYSVMKKRERADRAKAGAPKYAFDRVTLEHARDAFDAYCDAVRVRHAAWTMMGARAKCPKRHGEFCSPASPECPFYKDGRCEEIKRDGDNVHN